MSKRKKKNKYSTMHGTNRFAERMPANDKNRTSLIRLALNFGCCPEDFSGKFKTFLLNKAYKTRKRVKVYKGYIYIFFSTSSRLLTVYKVPDEFQNEETIDGININDIFVDKSKLITE